MPNEVTSLLNALNSYITCPVCKDTDEIDIILTCGHLICQSCKTKRTKCPVCFCELSATRSHSPSIKFIKELCKELLKASTDEKNCVQSELAVENSITNLNLKGEQTTRNDSEKIEKKLNFGFKEDVESSNDNVKVTNETNLSRNKASNTKNCNDKKKIVVCRNYIRHREEQKVYRKILKGLGIVGIDKQIDKVKCKHTLNTREKELNVQLNSIISRLNDQYPNKLNNDNLDKSKLKYFSKMSTDSDTDLIQNIKVNTGDTKDGFGDIKHDLKRKGLDLIKPCGSSKRKKVSINGEGHSSKTFMKNINVTEDCIEFSNDNSVNLDKKLGGIVDETELVQRYLNPPMKGVGKEEIKGEIKSCSDIGKTPKSFLSNKSEFANKEPPVVDKTITDDNKADELSKSKINIISQFMDEINLSSEENDLQSDIMADMFHNVSNEIVIDGNTLRTSVKNTEVCDNSMNDSCDTSSLKNPAVNESSPCKPNDNKIHSLTIKTETESNSDGNNDFIEVSDSEDETKQNPISDSSQTMSDQTDIYIEDVNIMNCRIVLKDLAPLMLQSLGSSTTAINDNCAGKSNVEKSVNKDCTGKTGLKNKSRKIKRDLAGKKRMSGNANLIQSLSKVPSGQKRSRCDEVCNNFEGFTEDDILILTVKLALFKMNGSKYSKNSSSSSLFALDGKQILIKDVSQEESHPEILCCPHKISDLTIEISDSEDESSKSQSVQTDSELLTVTPGPSTSKIRPVSNIKLHGFEIENEKFMQNDVLDIRKPLTPNTPVGKESIASSIQSSPLRTTPVSRRQLSFVSPSFEKNLQYEDDGASTSNLKATGSVSKSSSNEDWQVLHCRMQHMIPSNHEDTLHSEFARSGISATQLTFTTCGLNSKEIALVTKLAQMTKSCLTKDFTHNTTHLVIGAAGRGRLEYYLAIAYRAFIVTMDWVTLCLALHKILPVTGFIPTEDEGPLKCLEPSSLPFVGFHVFSKILPTSSSYPIAEITKTLLSLGGARVLPNLDAFQTLQDGNYPRVFIYNSKSVLTQAILDKCATLHILPIQFMWVYESIGAFRAIPVMDFLDVVIHSRTLIRDYKIPDYLACSRYPRLEGEFHPQILDERYQRSL